MKITGFNDGDMIQPPNTLMTVSTPGLTPTEAAAQFMLWSVMKTPLILGINWQQLADVATLDPEYFSLITNSEILSINQDPSPQAVLVAQYPSASQQTGAGRINVTLQDCDLSRPDQRFTSSPGGGISLEGTSLSLGLTMTSPGGEYQLTAEHTPTPRSVFAVNPDDQLTIASVTVDGAPRPVCLTDPVVTSTTPIATVGATACVMSSPIDHHSKSGTPIPLSNLRLGEQVFVWGSRTRQIVGAGSGR